MESFFLQKNHGKNKMKVEVRGRLRHCFFGVYSAVVVIKAETDFRNQKLHEKFQGFELQSNGKFNFLIATLDSFQLQQFKEIIEPLRNDPPCNLFDCRDDLIKERHDIDSLAHSVDFGPEFSFEIELDLDTTPSLFGNDG